MSSRKLGQEGSTQVVSRQHNDLLSPMKGTRDDEGTDIGRRR